MVQYLLTRTLDPLFALTIGFTSAFLRIHREETSRAIAAASTTNPHSPTPVPSQDVLTGSHETHVIEMGGTTRDGGDVKVPSKWDTWEIIKRRVANVDVRNWDIRDLWREKDTWGVVEPNRIGRQGE